ncbi:MAG: Mrp/NBP35 family ATP-binding protein [Methanococcoides sp.]|nr:Mrp/NBP35 family ATP-binding protein [Methanococcoides sp.]
MPENKKRHNASAKEEVKIHIKSSAKFIAVASGKGGVRKSTVAVNIAAVIARKGFKVGILDSDVYGFTIPKMLSITQKHERFPRHFCLLTGITS